MPQSGISERCAASRKFSPPRPQTKFKAIVLPRRFAPVIIDILQPVLLSGPSSLQISHTHIRGRSPITVLQQHALLNVSGPNIYIAERLTPSLCRAAPKQTHWEKNTLDGQSVQYVDVYGYYCRRAVQWATIEAPNTSR